MDQMGRIDWAMALGCVIVWTVVFYLVGTQL